MAKRAAPERIDVKGMDYAPTNELGVVYLFALLAPRLGFKGLERIQAAFPDAVARRRVHRGEQRVLIEFEYRSSSYKAHGHPRRKKVLIMCWIHDWPSLPKNIDVIELRREVGLGFDVRLQAVWEEYWPELDRAKRVSWSVPSLSKPGDLIIFYRTRPLMQIQEIYQQIGRTRPDPNWRYCADVRRICQLASPISLQRLKQERGLRQAGFMRSNLQGRPNVTAEWPTLYNMIVRLNRSCEKLLRKFAPEYL